VQFTHDLEAEVDGLQMPIEAGLPPLRFQKQPDTAHLTDELLDGLVGTYVLDALELVVSRRGERQLMASIAGGPAQELTPLRDRTFTIAGSQAEFLDGGRLITPFGEFVRKS
jgi:hypothetical protein